jgi:predicted ATP-grasp superfamily ATP-dependent carboligase
MDESQIRSLTWPGTQIFGLATPNFDFDFIIVRGVEPSMKWKTFTHDLLDLADDLEVQTIITLGSMLADTPHSRPITVTGSGAHPDLAKRLGVEVSRYEGPTGILGVIADACLRRGLDAISLWAAIPHYASNSPSPKATLALINALEDFLDISLPQRDLHADSLEWESEVDELAREDSDVAEYVKALEESKDSALLSDVSGEDLARELERFLRRQSEN